MISSRDRYRHLEVDREPCLSKARRASKVTVYDLIPEDDEPQASNAIKNSYSSFGDDAVGSLATKILYSLLPASQPFFRQQIEKSDFTQQELKIFEEIVDGEDGTLEEKLKRKLIRNSHKITNWFEDKGVRSTYNETVMHLIVAGNVVVKYTPEGARNYTLNNFVIVRDNESNTINELITRERIFKEALSPEYLNAINAVISTKEDSDERNEHFELFTHVKLNAGGEDYTITQEIETVELNRQDNVPKDELPFVAPRLYKDSDSNYGKSYVYRFYDDLRDLNNYRRLLVEASKSMARLIYLVKPNGRAKVRDVQRTKNGGFTIGEDGDITPLQAKFDAQISILSSIISDIEAKLRGNFLMLNVRSSERTTAEEIRAVQEELDQQLGGVFSTLSQELQLPSVKSVSAILVDTDESFQIIPGIHDKIVTGVEAIGRSQEMQTLRAFLATIGEAAGLKPELLDYVSEKYLAEKILAATGVDEKAFLEATEVEQIRAQRQQQAQQQAQQQQMLESGGKMAESTVNNLTKQ